MTQTEFNAALQSMKQAAARGEFVQVPEEMYWHFLNAVPPVSMRGNAFLAGEPVYHNERNRAVYCSFYHRDGRVLGSLQTLHQFTYHSFDL